jgi:hypothetical protein
LKQLGLIEFEAGERKVKSPVYEILNLNNLSKTFSKNRAEAEHKPSIKPNIINKQNINVNKKDNPPLSPKVEKGKPQTDYIDLLVQCFADAYAGVRGMEYVITNKSKERAAAAKILGIYKGKYPKADTAAMLESLKIYFESCLNISDKWLNQNMSLPTIINQFNQINNILKDGNKRTKGQPATTDAELAGIFAKHFACDYTE